MLTIDEKLANKERYLGIAARLGIDLAPLSKYLEAVNYFEKPATAQYGYSYPGGLCEQALKLCQELGNLCEAYFPGRYTEEDIIKVALFKDIYRAEMYEPYLRNVKNESTGQWEQVQAYRTKEERAVFGDLGFSSYMVAKNFADFTTEQIEAIIHSGIGSNYSVDAHEVMKQYPLAALTRMADMVVNYFAASK